MDTFEIGRRIREAPKEFLSSTERLLLMMMAHIGNTEGKNIHPGVKWLAEYTNLSKSSVIRSLASLVDKKVLRLLPNRDRGSHENACYEINIELLEQVRTNRSHLNKSYSNELKSLEYVKNKLVNYDSSSVTMTPGSSVTMTLDKNQVVSQCYQVGVMVTPGSSVMVTPPPYTPIIKPIDNHYYVEQKLDALLAAVEKKPKKVPKQKNSWTPEVMEVFKHWQEVLDHHKSRLDQDRRKHIVNALETGLSVDELKKAIQGVKNTPHNMGNNDRKKVYDDFDVIFRNSKQIERFIRNADTLEAPIIKNVSTARNLSFSHMHKAAAIELDKFADLARAEMIADRQKRLEEANKKESLQTLIQEQCG